MLIDACYLLIDACYLLIDACYWLIDACYWLLILSIIGVQSDQPGPAISSQTSRHWQIWRQQLPTLTQLPFCGLRGGCHSLYRPCAPEVYRPAPRGVVVRRCAEWVVVVRGCLRGLLAAKCLRRLWSSKRREGGRGASRWQPSAESAPSPLLQGLPRRPPTLSQSLRTAAEPVCW